MVLPIVVAADHRNNDGAHLGAFVGEIAKLLLNPESLVK
jgi:chloramphenicol O-acetyltransferase